VEDRLRQIEEAKKENADEFTAMHEQYKKMQASLLTMKKNSGAMFAGNTADDAVASVGDTAHSVAITNIIAAVGNGAESAVTGGGSTVQGGDELSGDQIDGALASAENLIVSEVDADMGQSRKGVISVVTFPNGDRYEGGFNKGLFSGWGVYYYHNGDRYDGEFSHDMKSGRGTFKFGNGDKYIGKFKDDMMDGYGAFSYAKKGQNMFFWLIEGIINLSLGIILIINPEWLAKFLLLLIGLWALILGIYQLYAGFINSKSIKNNVLLKINGLAAIVIGLVLLFRPDMVANFIIQLLGVISVLIGSIMMYFAFVLKKATKVQEAEIVDEPSKEVKDSEEVKD